MAARDCDLYFRAQAGALSAQSPKSIQPAFPALYES
ncbi:hypothetical protein DSM3645_21784 [Blastopirellula marina DSM 3645]|uniref:Uncharacterized protein n=1 Tax=Blastopirellula marina DSM 3645 TaxID=314230 RepID=A3ZUB2_9BACT|nr:hypothetical protein DSM3645_21784 [Blastopirellula marina DSM 3645]